MTVILVDVEAICAKYPHNDTPEFDLGYHNYIIGIWAELDYEDPARQLAYNYGADAAMEAIAEFKRQVKRYAHGGSYYSPGLARRK